MARSKLFFPAGLKFNLASINNNHSYEKKSILNVSLDAGCAISPDKTVLLFANAYDFISQIPSLICFFVCFFQLHTLLVAIPSLNDYQCFFQLYYLILQSWLLLILSIVLNDSTMLIITY